MAGAEQYLFEVMCALKNSFEVHLLCPGRGRLTEKAQREKIPTHVIPYFWFLTAPSFFWTQLVFLPANLITFFWIIRFMKKFKFDLVYTNTCVAVSGPLAAKVCNIPHIWNIQEAFGKGSYEYGFPFLSKKNIAAMILKLSHAVIVPSKFLRECFLKDTWEKISVVYHGIDSSPSVLSDEAKMQMKRHYEVGEKDMVLTVAGSLQERKGQWYAIQAMPSILKKYPHAKLLLAGEFARGTSDYKMKIMSEIKKHRLESVVKFLGYLSEPSSVYQITDILLVPSLYEPMGRTWVEASFYKVPSIASRVGGIPEVMEHGLVGLLVPPGDSKAITDAVLALAEDPQKLKTLGEKACQRIPQHFVMADTIAKIKGILDQTLQRDAR